MTGPAIPEGATVAVLRAAAAGCRACELWRLGTQTVFGEGPSPTELVLVGEQPGDREDVEGRPFVGPAGAVLDRNGDRDRASSLVRSSSRGAYR